MSIAAFSSYAILASNVPFLAERAYWPSSLSRSAVTLKQFLGSGREHHISSCVDGNFYMPVCASKWKQGWREFALRGGQDLRGRIRCLGWAAGRSSY